MLRKDDLLNETFEGYHITNKANSDVLKSTFLGEGVSEKNSGQQVFIEFLSTKRLHTQKEQQSFLQKLASLQQLHHPHILPILASGIHKEVPYIITERLNTGTLEERLPNQITKKPMQQEEAIHTLSQIGSALSYAHRQQIIHGFVQPHNVLFDLHREALLTGFSQYALSLSVETPQINSHETSIYLAPEQLIGQTSEKSDQYALGCIAYEMFTGNKAFMIHSVSKPGTYYRTKSLIAPRRLNPTLSPTIDTTILKAMSREPDQRFQDIATFLTELGASSLAEEDVTDTVGIIEQVTKEQSINLPITPLLELPKFETIKLAVPNQKLITNTDYPGTFKKSRQDITSWPRRTFAIIASLVAITLIVTTILITLNISTPTQRIKTVPTVQKKSTAYPIQSTDMPVSTVIKRGKAATPLGTGTPSLNRTPQPQTGLSPKPQQRPTSTSISNVIPTPTPIPTPGPAPTVNTTQVQIPLSGIFNDKGIGNTPGQANFDGAGFSYPSNQLPSGRLITLQGITYQFPGNAFNVNDNIIAAGQTISLTPGKYKQAFLLASASWGMVIGSITIMYTDGSTSMTQISISDWTAGPTGILNTAYRYNSVGIDNSIAHIYAIPIMLDNTGVATKLILPTTLIKQTQSGLMHVFAVTLHS